MRRSYSAPIPPALSPEQWKAAYEPETMASLGFEAVHTELVESADHGRWHQAVALANAALPQGDPRKLTHAHVVLLRAAAGEALQPERRGDLLALAELLASVLPPGGILDP